MTWPRRRTISMSERFGRRVGTEWQRDVVSRLRRLDQKGAALGRHCSRAVTVLAEHLLACSEVVIGRKLTPEERADFCRAMNRGAR